MKVYGASLSPFVRKVLVFAAEKGIEVEHDAMMGARPEAFQQASPFGKIPGFSDGDFHLSDSSAIVAYMEKVRPDPALIPAEAKAHARTIWFDEYADTILTAAGVPIFFNRIVARLLGMPQDLAAAEKAEKDLLPPALAYLESVAPAQGFLVGESLTLADISVGSVMVNLAHLNIPLDAYPKAKAYVARVHARPAFAQALQGEGAFLKSAGF